jgi:hypothetical protein
MTGACLLMGPWVGRRPVDVVEVWVVALGGMVCRRRLWAETMRSWRT